MRRLIRTQRGDTIVEVMVAISVVSLVLVTAYATTRRSLNTMQDTQEHSEALQLLQSQIEFIHSTHNAPPSGGCFYKDGTYDHGPTDALCTVDATGTHTGTSDDLYKVSVTSASTVQGTIRYTVNVEWDSLLQASTKNNVTIYYQQYATD